MTEPPFQSEPSLQSAVSVKQHSAHSVNAELNRCVFNLDLKVFTVEAHLISSGS